ncbi:Ribosomal silencing factor [Desulfonema limicola]|uniref:Ribosomal silencing factor RsfS n=1 Tax=Desulfonema limicola TaxID=45656 RepID=A0A975B6G0_9BACT|nr:ribosome silencing factor [Desulfonema limicola]QTA79625.1 Ribosomal silencing factor [Desulfonema limicola]
MTYNDPSLDFYVKAIYGKKAYDVVAIDVQGLTSVADIFIVCSGSSNRQVSAIAEHIQKELKNYKIKPLSIEGIKEGHWVLLDYGHIIIHVFYDTVRSFYNIESLWADAPRIKTPAMIEHEQSLPDNEKLEKELEKEESEQGESDDTN